MRTEGTAGSYYLLAWLLSAGCSLYEAMWRIWCLFLSSASIEAKILQYYADGPTSRPPPHTGVRRPTFLAWIRTNRLKNMLVALLPSAMMTEFVRVICPVDQEAAGRIHLSNGSVVAVPHFGEFVPAIIAMALCAAPSRRVAIFYESPDAVTRNAVFDGIAERAIPRVGRDVVICHNNAHGLAAAMKTVRSGGTLIIMPDVLKDPSLGTVMPFLSRSFVAMTGIAAIVRKTGAALVPVVPRTLADQPMVIGEGIRPDMIVECATEGDELFPDYVDYCVTRRMFESLSSMIGDRQVFWRYWHGYAAPFDVSGRDAADKLDATAILKDPWLSVHARQVMDIRPAP